jgi:S-adenosylmethionine uptake transporter
MTKGVFLAFLTYALYSSSDALVKSLGGRMPVVEIVFVSTLANFIVILCLRPPRERWRDMFRMNHPGYMAIRCGCALIAALGSTFAFTTVPLAEAYALIFLAPLLVTLLSIPILGEPVGWRRLSAVGVGLCGILLVVKPGFSDLHLGHLAAFIVAFAGASSMIVMRLIGRTERRVSLLGLVMVSCIVVSGILMIPVFVWPPLDVLPPVVLIGVVGGIGQVTILAATRNAPASRVAPTQYSQIVWAVVFGALFFREIPDGVALVGIALIGFSGLFTFLREDKVSGWSRRIILMRNQP